MNKKSFLTRIKRGIGVDKDYNKEKKKVEKKARKEAEEIFMKTQPGSGYKKGNQKGGSGPYPKVDSDNINTKYGKRAKSVEDQVVKTRLKQFKNKKKASK